MDSDYYCFLIRRYSFYNYFSHFNDSPFHSQEYAGQFGDYIGGALNPILSFFSLIALLWTIGIQSKELELTRDELKRSAEAQEATKAILDKQSETLARQQFESTFFSLLDQHNKLLESLTNPRVGEKGTVISEVIENYSKYERDIDLDFAHKILESQNLLCGHYFRVLYQLLKFIATSSPGGTIGYSFEADKIKDENVSDNEKMYSNIVRSFLGYEITQLLSINCFCTDPDDTYWRYRLLIERYSFLEHMFFRGIDNRNIKFMLILEETITSYDIRAFGDNSYVKWYIERQQNKESVGQQASRLD